MHRLLVLGTVGGAFGLAGCGDAILLEITGDREIPIGLDAICVGVADVDEGGGQFGRAYRLEGKLASLPQTLRLEPGGAATATTWVRGDRGGVPVVRATQTTDFGEDIVLALDRCPPGRPAAPQPMGDPAGPAGARLVASQGPGGTLVVAIGTTESAILDAAGGTLRAELGPTPPAGLVTAALAADVDGDCDDDLVIAAMGAPPVIWRRDGNTFTASDVTLGTAAAFALAAADVDRDGDIDLVSGQNATLALWLNDAGVFTQNTSKLSAAGRVTSVRALALADLDGDGNPDLVVGQSMAPLRSWVGDATGSFERAEAVPAVSLDVTALHLADADDDYDPDLAVAVAGAPMRLYINRHGRLENQASARLPDPAPVARAIAIGSWNGGCLTDALIATDAMTLMLRGGEEGVLTADAMADPATDVVMTDLDDDGDLDAVISTANGARWFAR